MTEVGVLADKTCSGALTITVAYTIAVLEASLLAEAMSGATELCGDKVGVVTCTA